MKKSWWTRLFAGKSAARPEPEMQTASRAFVPIQQALPLHPSRGLTPVTLAALLAGAETGDLMAQASLAEDMEEKDAHLFAELSKRKRALLQLDWTVKPPQGSGAREKRQAAECREWLEALPDFEDVLLDLGGGLLHGYAALELEWQQVDGLWRPAAHYRPPDWFQLDPETRSEVRLRSTGDYRGDALRPLGWILHRHQSRSGYLARSGLVRILAWPWLFKNYAVGDLAELLELHGLPVRLATYPTFLSETDKKTIWDQLRQMGRNAAALLPEGVKVEFSEIQSKGESYEVMIDWCERSISKAILGQTLSAESSATGLGSGVAKLHDDVRWDLISSDAKQIAGTITRQLLAPMLALNREIDPNRLPQFAFDLREVGDLAQYADALPKLVTIGLPIPVSWANDRLGIPAPADNEPVLTAPSAAAPATALRQSTAVLSAATDPVIDPTAPMVECLAVEADPLIQALLAPIQALLENSADLAEFRDQLASLYPALDGAALATLMGQALAVADAAGRLEAQL